MKRRHLRNISRAVLSFYLFASVHVQGATTDLASVPLVTSSTSSVLPNLMFIMDDSGSMDWDYMPDWANSSTTSLFRNNGYNGVYYTPAVTYSPPIYYNAAGTLNTTTYPTQNSANTSVWTKVKVDGYGVQSTSTVDLTSSAYFYTFIPGRYCSDAKLRNCVLQGAASATRPFPAPLRWCTDSTYTNCQGVRIEEGSTLYETRQVADGAANVATISLSGSDNAVVTSITVNGDEIMSGSTASSGTSSTVASRTVTKINDCTAAATGNCDLSGFSASSSGGTITISPPSGMSSITFTPVLTKTGTINTVTISAFTGGGSGSNTRTDIVSGTTSYPFPGTSAKASTRTDCAGTTCTYAEEMTNYANWYAYYRTRMQMMKTATGHAFQSIGSTYRIGYMTINNETGSDFVNISNYNAAQKKAWYDKLYATKPGSGTPLRQALANAGRIYAGKLNGTTFNGVTVVDPVQYSCQQNFTILSTDGYWNGSAGFKEDGTAFGTLNPDGADIRPYNDGATLIVTAVTPYVTTVQQQTVQNVSIATPWSRTVTTVGGACTVTATLPGSCAVDQGTYSGSGNQRTWCITTSSTDGSDCTSIGAGGLRACRGSGSTGDLPSTGQACRTGSDGIQWCIYQNNSTGTSCVEMVNGANSGTTASQHMYACRPPTGVTGNFQISAPQTYTQTQTGTTTTVNSIATTTNSTVITTNGVAAPATTSSGGSTTTLVSNNTAFATDTGVPGVTTTWSSGTSTSVCTASAAASTSAAVAGSTVTTNVGAAAVTTLSTVGPVQGTTTTSSTSSGGVLNTLADVAQYYYTTDLRTTALSNCTGVAIPPAATGLDVCGATATADLMQRMVTFTLGLGASGQMQYSPTYATQTSGDYFDVKNGTVANAATGTCIWQSSGSCNWPTPASSSQMNIDDLWHAAVNGRGQYFSATNPATLTSGLQSALAGVTSQLGSSAAATTSNPNVTSGDNFVFSTTFRTVDWDGQLVRNQLDLVTGVVSSTDDWEARSQLNSNASRNIYTFDSTAATKLKTFTWANLTTAQQAFFQTPNISSLTQFCGAGPTCLSAADQTAAAGSNLVDYLRGVRTNEGIATDVTKYYRSRSHVLGDIVNAEAVYVKIPLLSYADSGFDTYKTTAPVSTRPGMVYSAANDGMLHAFNASTGAEAWAYVPTLVMSNLHKLADKNYSALHQFYVDGTPVIGDAYLGGAWKTILVGGLNNGGRGYYALDITDPSAPKALWEFTDANMGFTYGNPIITKLQDGTWVVLVTSGYNNVPAGSVTTGDGIGRLFVINAATGAKIREISTGVGSVATPSGLSKINAWVDAASTDNTTLRVYGGDLLGNLWRFDINDIYGAAGYDAHKLVTVYANAAGTITQPITSKPELGEASSKPIILAGTGRFLGATDLSDTTQNSFYAVKDKLDATTFINPRTTGSGFKQQTMSETTCPAGTPTSVCTSGQLVRISTNEQTVDFNTDNGWFLDLIGSGERANTDPTLALGTLGFTTNIPNSSACTAGGTSFRYFLDYTKGTPISTARSSSSGVGVVGVSFGNALATRGVFVRLPNNTVVQLTRLSTGTTVTSNVPIGAGGGGTRRVSWRELITEQ